MAGPGILQSSQENILYQSNILGPYYYKEYQLL